MRFLCDSIAEGTRCGLADSVLLLTAGQMAVSGLLVYFGVATVESSVRLLCGAVPLSAPASSKFEQVQQEPH